MREIALDTNAAVDLLNGKSEVIQLIQSYEIICLPVIVCGELLFGAKNSGKRKKNEKKYQDFISSCIILDTNELIADAYAEIRLELKRKGKPIPENDIWISAICKVNNMALMTHDKHFVYIEKLKLIKLTR